MDRKVFFYTSRFYKYDPSSPSSSATLAMTPDEIRETFAELSGFEYDESSAISAYTNSEDGKIAMVIDQSSPNIRGIIFQSRRRNIPNIESGGKFRSIGLTSSEGISESSHFVIFPQDENKSVLALENNIYAPRAINFPNHLMYCSDRINTGVNKFAFVHVVQITRGNVFEELRRRGNIADIEIEVNISAKDTIREIDTDFGDYLDAAQKLAPEAWLLSMGFRRRPHTRTGGMGGEFKERVINLLESTMGRGVVNSAKAKVESSDSNSRKLLSMDLLSDKYVAEITLPPISRFLGEGVPTDLNDATPEQLDNIRQQRSRAIYESIERWYINSDIEVNRSSEEESDGDISNESEDDQDTTE